MARVGVDGLKLRLIRLDKGMTARELAQKSGLKERTILGIENKGHQTREESLLALAKALGVSPSELLSKQGRAEKGDA